MTIEQETGNLTSLARCYSTYYSEFIIQNNTTITIMMIDALNNKHAVPPVSMTPLGPENILILSRKTVGPSLNNNGESVGLPGVLITIPKTHLLSKNSIFIKELNIVICTQAAAISVRHPCRIGNYADALYELRTELSAELQNAPTLKLLANDPKQRCTALYTVIGSSVVGIPVTNHDNGYGTAELRIEIMGVDTPDEIVIGLEEFLDSGESLLELNDGPLPFIAINRQLASRVSPEYRRISQIEVDKILKQREDQYAKNYKSIKDSYESEIRDKETALQNLKTDYGSLKTEYTRLKTEYDSFSGLLVSDQKAEELSYKRRKSANDTTAEQWKTIGVYGSIGVAVLALILKGIDLYTKFKKF